MTYSEAYDYLRDRFGKVAAELICTDTGYCTGIIFKVGRSKHTVCGNVNEARLRLFADCIDYAATKRARKAA